MMEACEKVNLLSFIQKLPQKLDTKIHDSGIRLSGGQKQRLAISHKWSEINTFPRIIIVNSGKIVADTPIDKLDEAEFFRLFEL